MIWIILVLVVLLILYLIFKPYFIKYDATLSFTGGLGSGKTLNAVKTGTFLYKKYLRSTKIHNWLMRRINQFFIIPHNKKAIKYNEKHKYDIKPKMHKIWYEKEQQELPRFFSNIPVVIGKKKGKKIYCNVIEKDMLLLIIKGHNYKDGQNKAESKGAPHIPEHSIVLLDEFPQLINQFNWNQKVVQENVNEFITFFRHYINGQLIITAQSIDDIVCEVRRKLNTYYWLFDFHKIFHFFYKVRICQFQSSDIVSNVNMGFIEENCKWKYGTLFTRKYDSRCYSERYPRETDDGKYKKYTKMKTNKIIRFTDYKSPLDTKEEK